MQFLAGHRTENVDFWRVTLVLYPCMWLLGSPDTDIVSVHLATDMECGIIAEDEPFYEIWDEFYYRVDVCSVTQGAHIEGLW